MIILDPSVVAEAKNVSEQDLEKFKYLSEQAIKHNFVQPLSVEGFYQAVENIAYHLTKFTLYTYAQDPDPETFDCDSIYEDEVIGKDVAQLDEIIWKVALASGVHPDYLGVLVDIQIQKNIDTMFPDRK